MIGGRGSGKTTLLRVAAGLERPDSGSVSLDGKRLDAVHGGRRGGLPPAWSAVF